MIYKTLYFRCKKRHGQHGNKHRRNLPRDRSFVGVISDFIRLRRLSLIIFKTPRITWLEIKKENELQMMNVFRHRYPTFNSV